MATLPRTVDNEAAIPEGATNFYVERDGAYHLDFDQTGLKTDEDVTRLTDALNKERDLRETAQREAGRFKGVDLDEYERLKKGKGGDEDAEARFKTALDEKDQEIATLSGDLDELAINNTLRAAAVNGVTLQPGAVDDMLRFAHSRDDAGRVWRRQGKEAVLVDADDKVVYSTKDPTVPLSPGEWLEGLTEKKRHWFGESSGSGAGHQRGGGSGSYPAKRSEFTNKQKAQYIGEKGQDAYFALPE